MTIQPRLFAIALGLSLAAARASAQNVSDAESFIEAIEDRDGAKVTQLFEARPAVINSRNAKGQAALVIAIKRHDELFTRFLISSGADPNLGDRGGDTPLIAAARIGFEDAVEWLLSKGARVDGANSMGETGLIVAAQGRHLKIVQLLLARGANPDRTDSAQGFSARDYAKRDPRAREILAAIEQSARKPAAPAKSDKLDDFKL